MNIMKKLIVVTLVLSFVLALVPMSFVSADTWNGDVADKFASGTGTEADPFIIKTAAELAYLAVRVNGTETVKADGMLGQFIKLDADIDLAGKQWTPIGDAEKTPFEGTFDGGDHTISGLFIDMAGALDIDEVSGLFGATEGATIKNFFLLGTKVNGGKYVGGAVAKPKKGSYIINVSVNIAEVIGEVTGGVVGRSEAKGDTTEKRRNLILCCTFEGSVYGTSEYYGAGRTAYVGGIVGVAGEADIRYCINKGNVTADLGGSSKVPFAGGIIGCSGASSGTTIVDHCINLGAVNVKGDNCLVGGITARPNHVAGGMVVYCLNLGTVSSDGATTRIGAIAGQYKNASAAMGYVHNVSVKVGELPLEGFDAGQEKSEQAIYDDEFYMTDDPMAEVPRSCVFIEASAAKVANLKGYTSDYWQDGTACPEPKKDAVIAKVLSDTTWFETEPLPTAGITTAPEETTKAPETSKAPETTKPVETTKAPDPTTPVTEAPKEEKGCGGMIAGGMTVLAVVALAGVMLKKKD